MKRAIFMSILLILVAGIVAAQDKALSSEVRTILEKAVTNEREAVIRYNAYAAKAEEEGYAGAAALFRAQAKAEAIHAQRFADALKEHGASVPGEVPPFKPAVGSTGDNLRSTATAETAERDGMYRDAIAAAQRNKDDAIAKIFDQTRDTEVEHANLCAAAARNMASMKDQKVFYVCSHCGYTTDIKLPLCPDCMSRHDMKPVE